MKTPVFIPPSRWIFCLFSVMSIIAIQSVAAQVNNIAALSIEELMAAEVTTLSKKPERRFSSAAAVYVLTQEDIRRSGVTTIPEVLKLVPGVQVARIDANKWAVGVRGFASRLSRSLLVLIDGRSVYSPLFAGVYWEVQDVLLEDIERIEVILGPGGALWGANAINGVVNIITRDARDTPDNMVYVAAGSEVRFNSGVRVHRKLSDQAAWRAYAKVFEQDAMFHEHGEDFDDWRMGRAGFRMDSLGNKTHLTVQGDVYDGYTGQRLTLSHLTAPFQETVIDDSHLSGANFLARWEPVESDDKSTWALQAYVDRTERDEPQFDETRDTFDIDFQHRIQWSELTTLIWGAGYRISEDDTMGIDTIEFDPSARTDELYSVFAEGDFTLVPATLFLVAGTKFERNDYSGYEQQPSLRLSWLPTARSTFWLSASSAVRTPSRVESDLMLSVPLKPATRTFARVLTDESFEPEKVISYEGGFRTQLQTFLSLEMSIFYNRYLNYLSLEQKPPFFETGPDGTGFTIVPYFIENGMRVKSHGFELAAQWLPDGPWRISGHYAYLNIDAQPGKGSTDSTSEANIDGGSPQHQFFLRFGWQSGVQTEYNVDLRYVSELEDQNIPSYRTVDFRVSRWITDRLEMAVVGRNLFDSHHPEFEGSGGSLSEVERSAYLKTTWHW